MYNFMAKLLNFIESSTDQTKSEIIIAEYILRNVEKIPKMSIYELAKNVIHHLPCSLDFVSALKILHLKNERNMPNHLSNLMILKWTIKILKRNSIYAYYDELHTSLKQTEQLPIQRKLFKLPTQSITQKSCFFWSNIFSPKGKKCTI